MGMDSVGQAGGIGVGFLVLGGHFDKKLGPWRSRVFGFGRTFRQRSSGQEGRIRVFGFGRTFPTRSLGHDLFASFVAPVLFSAAF